MKERRIGKLLAMARRDELVHPDDDKPALYPNKPEVLHEDDAFTLAELGRLRSDLAEGFPLSPEHRELIIDLIDNYLKLPPRRGRPRGSGEQGLWELARQYVAALSQIRKQDFLAEHPNQRRISDANEFVRQAIEIVEQHCPELRGQIQLPRDLNAIRKCRSSLVMLRRVRRLIS